MFPKKIVLLCVIILVLNMCLAGCSAGEQADTGEQAEITLTDLAGREVKLAAPAERVVLANGRFVQEFAAIEGDDFTSKLVGIGSDLYQFDQDIYAKYLEKFPELKDIADIGHFSKGNLNVEKIVSLKPDVVLIQLWFLQTAADVITTLEQAGIPVVIIDFSINPLTGPPESILVMGKLLGAEQRAQDIAAYFEQQVTRVFSTLDKITTEKPTVYVENGGPGPAQYGKTYGNTAWGKIVKSAGGVNIAEELVEGMGDIALEYLFDEDPDNIIIAGYSSERIPDALRFGYNVKAAEAKGLLTGYLNRPGWDSLQAVKNKRVYGVSMGHCIQIYNFFPLQAFAKWFYPAEFTDLDPEQNLKEFHERFAAVDYSGTWLASIE